MGMGIQLSAFAMSTPYNTAVALVKLGLLVLLTMAIVSPPMSTTACLGGGSNNNNNNNNNNGGDGGGTGGGDGGGDGGEGDGCNNNNNNNRNCNNNNNNNGRMESSQEEPDLEIQAFKICDTNKDDALTWQEVEDCEEKYCKLVNFECPSEEEFNYFDTNADGMLTLEEYYENLA